MKMAKIYNDDNEYFFMNELKLYWEINHENIVRYFDHFNVRKKNQENCTFLIIEYCEVSKDIHTVNNLISLNMRFKTK